MKIFLNKKMKINNIFIVLIAFTCLFNLVINNTLGLTTRTCKIRLFDDDRRKLREGESAAQDFNIGVIIDCDNNQENNTKSLYLVSDFRNDIKQMKLISNDCDCVVKTRSDNDNIKTQRLTVLNETWNTKGQNMNFVTVSCKPNGAFKKTCEAGTKKALADEKAKVSSLTDEKNTLYNEFVQMSMASGKYLVKINSLKTESKKLTKENTTNAANITKYKAQILSLEGDSIKQNTKITEYTTNNNTLKTKNKSLAATIEKNLALLKKIQKETSEKQSEITKLKSASTNKDKLMATNKSAAEESLKKLTKLGSEIQSLTEQNLEEVKKNKLEIAKDTEQDKQIAACKKELDEQKNAGVLQKTALTDEKTKNTACTKKNNTLDTKNKNLSTTIVNNQKELLKIQDEIAKQKTKITNLKTSSTTKDTLISKNQSVAEKSIKTLNSQITTLTEKNKSELEKNKAEIVKDTEQDNQIATCKKELEKQKKDNLDGVCILDPKHSYFDTIEQKLGKKKKLKIDRKEKKETTS